jgi:hypothetical protein
MSVGVSESTSSAVSRPAPSSERPGAVEKRWGQSVESGTKKAEPGESKANSTGQAQASDPGADGLGGSAPAQSEKSVTSAAGIDATSSSKEVTAGEGAQPVGNPLVDALKKIEPQAYAVAIASEISIISKEQLDKLPPSIRQNLGVERWPTTVKVLAAILVSPDDVRKDGLGNALSEGKFFLSVTVPPGKPSVMTYDFKTGNADAGKGMTPSVLNIPVPVPGKSPTSLQAIMFANARAGGRPTEEGLALTGTGSAGLLFEVPGSNTLLSGMAAYVDRAAYQLEGRIAAGAAASAVETAGAGAVGGGVSIAGVELLRYVTSNALRSSRIYLGAAYGSNVELDLKDGDVRIRQPNLGVDISAAPGEALMDAGSEVFGFLGDKLAEVFSAPEVDEAAQKHLQELKSDQALHPARDNTRVEIVLPQRVAPKQPPATIQPKEKMNLPTMPIDNTRVVLPVRH